MTPTSATGAERVRRAGFTLVELLLALAIIGLAAAAVTLAAPDPRPSLAREADRLAARALRAQETALIENKAVALEIDARGYGFRIREAGAWRALEKKPFARVPWEEGTAADLGGARAVRFAFDPTGLAEPARVALRRDGDVRILRLNEAGEIEVAANAR